MRAGRRGLRPQFRLFENREGYSVVEPEKAIALRPLAHSPLSVVAVSLLVPDSVAAAVA